MLRWIAVLVLLLAGWKGLVWWFGRDEKATLPTIATPVIDSTKKDSIKVGYGELDTIPQKRLLLPTGNVDTKGVQPQQLVSYAQTLIGTPYLYGSTDPAKGFDCSGFITYVFNHFGIAVPRSSIDFTHVGKEVSAAQAAAGDLILFTGTDSADRFVGHMGIVVSNTDTLRFIHSTSGKQHGVTITPISKYYQGRYVKTVRVFP